MRITTGGQSGAWRELASEFARIRRRGFPRTRCSVIANSFPSETFDIDANSIVNVSAKDKATGKEQQIGIQASGGLSEADIDKMVKNAEANAAADKKRREAVDAKNHADGLVHSTEKALAEHGSKIAESERRAIDDAVSDLKEVLKGDDAEAIKAKTNTLAQVSMKLGEAMYKQQAQGHAAKAAGQDDVIDAEFEEVDKRDRKAG